MLYYVADELSSVVIFLRCAAVFLSAAMHMPSPLHILSTLQPTELGQNHTEFVVDVTDCVGNCDAQYGCTDVACRQVHLILDSERPRGQCSFIRTSNKLYV